MKNYILTRKPDQPNGQPDWSLRPQERVMTIGIPPLIHWDYGWITQQVLSMKVGEAKIIQANI
jgi:hypothetical protein